LLFLPACLTLGPPPIFSILENWMLITTLVATRGKDYLIPDRLRRSPPHQNNFCTA
jgi:hypothetical protein